MSKVFSVRLADDLAGRVEEIAAARGVKSPSVLKAAVEGYLDDGSRGLPDVPSATVAAAPESAPRRAPAKTPEEFAEQRSRLAALRAEAAGHAKRAREERERKHAERGW